MSSKKWNMDWPSERTVKSKGVLKRFRNEETVEIPAEISYRVNQNVQADQGEFSK